MISVEQANELIIYGQSLLYLAERKVLLFLTESREYWELLAPLITTNVRTEYDDLTYQPGQKIELIIQPLTLYETNFLSHQYQILTEDSTLSFDIKGVVVPRLDTIWLPTNKLGYYRIEGKSTQFGRAERNYNWVYEYKVVAS